MQTYIGVKKVNAYPEERNGAAGYHVIYEDGYESWSPKDVFERAYMPIELNDKLAQTDIDNFFNGGVCSVTELNGNTTLLQYKAPTGFFWIESSSCVEPKNYDRTIGEFECTKRIKDKIWNHLGFVLAWAQHGLK